MSDIFLSYSRDDQAVARRFAEGLEREGFSVWWDQTLRTGEAYDHVTEQALRAARAVVVLWSQTSTASRWVRAEATIADRQKTLMPVMIEPCDRPVMFELTQTADLSHWKGDASDSAWRAYVADLRALVGRSGAGARVVAPGVTPPLSSRPPRRKWLVPVAIVSTLLLAGLVTWPSWRGDPARATRQASAGAGAAGSEQMAPVKLAVLPFADLSPSRDQEYFSDGVAQEIQASLSRLSGLQVTPTASSFYFKGREDSPKRIAELLGVDYLLAGSVRKSAESLRISAELVKVSSNSSPWSQTYDGTLQDVFTVQEEIARSVATELQVALGVGEVGQLPGVTRDVQAYQMWLEAGSIRGQTVDSLRRAIGMYESVVRKDPSFELAWLNLYDAHMVLGSLYGTDDAEARNAFDKGGQVLAEGARLNPEAKLLQLAKESSGLIDGGYWSQSAPIWEEIRIQEQEYARVGIITSSWGWAGWLVSVDKSAAAIPLLEEARKRDPFNSGIPVFLAEAYANLGRMNEAKAEYQRGMRIGPSPVLAVNALLAAIGTGDAVEIERAWQQVPKDDARAQRFFELRDRKAEALREVRRLADASPRVLAASRLALWAVVFGDPGLALRVLREDQNRDRRRVTAMALWRPVMSGARKLPEFKLLMQEWGFVDYWKQYGWGDHCKPVGSDDFECR